MSRAQRWTAWTLRKNPDLTKKPSKVPIADPTDQTTWTYFHAARATLDDPKIAGLGFEMHGKPGVVGIDIDRCLDEAGQKTSPAAKLLTILEAAGGRFHVEITPSGHGYRIFAAETELPFHDYTNNDTGFEVYTGEKGRFLTFTGALVPGFGEGPFDPLPPEAVELLGQMASPGKWKTGAARADGSPQPAYEVPPLPELSRREDWEKLHPGAIKRLHAEHKEFLKTGALGRKYASASEQLFAIEQALLKHLKPPQAYQILISAEGSWGVALEHREGSEAKAFQFIWDDLCRAQAGREKFETQKALETTGWKECDIQIEITEDGARARVLQLNVINAFTKHSEWLERLGYNTFDGRVTLDKKDVSVRQLAEMSAWLCDFLKWQFEPRREMFEEAVIEAAKTRPWSPIADELQTLVWDGKKRIKKFTEAIVENPQPLDYEIMRKWLVGFIARGMEPGCQMDTVLCLREREGGGYKTSFCRVMAGGLDRFTDSPSFGTDKDSAMMRGGMRIIELGEGVAVKKADRFTFKNDVTKLDDPFRPPWGRMIEKRKRGFVYILTANEKAMFRSDQDGLRRLWPVDCRPIMDIEWIRENREQVLAEAMVQYLASAGKRERWWWDKGTEPLELKQRQHTAVAEDFLDSAVESVVHDRENIRRGYTTLSEIKTQVEAVAGLTLSTGQAQHLLDILGKHGLTPGQRRIDGRKLRVWEHESWKGTGEATVVHMDEKARVG